MTRSVARQAAWLLLALVPAALSRGQGPADPELGGPAERSAEMARIAASFAVSRDGERVPLRAEPLLRWSDPTRQFSDASLWAWGKPGRPAALLALELYPHSESGPDHVRSWAHEFISLSLEPLDVEGVLRWSPRRPGVAFHDIPDAPPPAPVAAARLAQMRELAARFSATEHPGGDVTLRLMPQPVGRYADPVAGLVDGAIFAFANGTNPEVLLLIEARGPSWAYAVARITAAPYEVKLDRREVWSQPYAADQRDHGATYFTARLPRKAPR